MMVARPKWWRSTCYARSHYDFAVSISIAAVLVVCCGLDAAVAEEETKSSDVLEVMAWCKAVNEGLDWSQVLRVAKSDCFENTDDNAVLRVRCSTEAVANIVDAAKLLLELSSNRAFACANGLAFVFSVSLAYGRDLFEPRDAARAQVLLWGALQENFLMDASIWPVKTHDVLQLFQDFPAALTFPPLKLSDNPILDEVTFLVPRCPPTLRTSLLRSFPGAKVFAGVRDRDLIETEETSSAWKLFKDVWHRPLGAILNDMLFEVTTPLAFVIVGNVLPRGVEDVERMVHVIANRRVFAVGGPLVDSARVYSDFCYKLQLRHYRLSFDTTYEHSIIFDHDSAAAIRGSWFREEVVNQKQGPCKLCDTLPPAFLARSEALYALRFNPLLDGDWTLLDLAMRASRAPLMERKSLSPNSDRSDEARDGNVASSAMFGWRHGPARLATCPFVNIREVPLVPTSADDRSPAVSSFSPIPRLYGRQDVPRSGVAQSMAWFGSDGVALGPASGHEDGAPHYLKPSEQFKTFMDANHLREFIGPEGVKRHWGSTLASVNCPVPNWVYRGWAAPTCCKETMRHLLFYIGDVFSEMNIRYIVTDGVLLGSYKFGGMLDWDADVDLHIHNDDFWRLEDEVAPRVARDGHFLRKHVNNNSWLLQANEQNYLLIELNKRGEAWDPDRVWHLPVEGRLFPAMEDAHLNLSAWYGMSFFQHRLRHVPEWEEKERPMYCATPYHYNCVDGTQVPSGGDCLRAGVC